MSHSTPAPEPTSNASVKKPYSQPTLTEYGSVSKLTMIKGSTVTEGGTPFAKKCL